MVVDILDARIPMLIGTLEIMSHGCMVRTELGIENGHYMVDLLKWEGAKE